MDLMNYSRRAEGHIGGMLQWERISEETDEQLAALTARRDKSPQHLERARIAVPPTSY